MTKTKVITNLIVSFLVVAAAFSLYIATRPKTAILAPTFVYEEVVVHKTAALPVPIRPVSVPLPVIPPQVVSSVLPEYPSAVLQAGIEGLVMVQAYVGLNGTVEKAEAKTSSGNTELDQSAARAVAQWRFTPASQGGTALASWFEVPVRFSIK
ncbi:energy transducer TonB [Candidatus Saganbacteria bacterium]|nr:energy transducer TonB [Candidatus Saganbacteria bacterium]